MPQLNTQTILKEILLPKVLVDGSIQSSQEGIALTNDSDTPGANKVYGTDENGNKGWISVSVGGINKKSIEISSEQLTNAEIADLISAPGEGKAIIINKITIVLYGVSTAYSNTPNFSIGYPSIPLVSDITVHSAAGTLRTIIPDGIAVSFSLLENKKIEWAKASGDNPSGGDGKVRITIDYDIISTE